MWKSNFGRLTPSTRCCLRSFVCSMAWSFQAIDATLFLVPVACAALQLSIKIAHLEWFPDVNDIGRELDKGYMDGTKPTSGDAYVAGFSLAGLFDCKRAEQQV